MSPGPDGPSVAGSPLGVAAENKLREAVASLRPAMRTTTIVISAPSSSSPETLAQVVAETFECARRGMVGTFTVDSITASVSILGGP